MGSIHATFTTKPGADGEEQPATLSLVWFAIARAQNTRLARYFLSQGAAPDGLWAAAWWGNADIIPDLVTRGADLNDPPAGTPFHMAVDVAQRGIAGKPALARARVKTLEVMLKLGANPNLADARGRTPLGVVLEKDYGIEIFSLLLKHGANPDTAGPDGRSVRAIAARKRDRRYARALERMR